MEASAKDELIRGNPLILGGAAPFQVRVTHVYHVRPLCFMPGDVKCGHVGSAARFQVLMMGVPWYIVPLSREAP